jgi:hypothetical protein
VAIPAHAAVGHVYNVNLTSDTNIAGSCSPAPSSDPCELRWAFNSADADPGSVINVPTGHYALALGQLVNLANGTEVDGASSSKTIIDAGGNSRVLYNSGSLTLTGVTLENGNAASDDGRGGGLNNAGHLNLSYVVFLGNVGMENIFSGDSEGGGLYNSGNANVSKTRFYDNYAYFGGGYFDAEGAVLTMSGSIVGDDRIDHGNTARQGGGGYEASNGTYTGVTFEGNSALGSIGIGEFEAGGGGLFMAGLGAKVLNSEIKNNVALYGGGIAGNSYDITESKVSGNFAFLGGGVVSVFFDSLFGAPMSGRGVLSSANSFSNNVSLVGGAVLNAYSFSSTKDRFTKNQACLAGGAVFNGNLGLTPGPYMTMNAPKLASNVAGQCDLDTGTTGVGREPAITSESVFGSGGAIYNDGDLALASAVLNGNAASGDGGAVANTSSLNMTRGKATNNLADGDGGAVYNGDHGGAALTISQVTLQKNRAQGDGGGLMNDGCDVAAIIADTFTRNVAGGVGGGIETGPSGNITPTTKFSGNAPDNLHVTAVC